MTGLPLLREARRALRARRAAWREAGNRSGTAYAVTLLTPVLPHRGPHLARRLRSLGLGPESPLAKLPSVHFARWVVIDQLKMDWPGAPRPAPRLRSEYLLFTADVTVPPGPEDPMPEGFLRELLLRVPDVVDDVWGHCEGWPRVGTREERVRYLADSRVDTALYYVGHPNATVDEIRHALAVRDALVAFVREHQDTEDPAALHQDYVERSRAWLGST